MAFHPAAASSANKPLVRAFLDRLFGRRSPRLPGLHDSTDWLGVRHTFTRPMGQEEFFSLAALNYTCGVAHYFQSGDGRQRPGCTLAHVAAAVSLVDHDALLTALATEPDAARLVQPLLDARGAGATGQVAGIIPVAHALVADLHRQVDSPTRARVLAHFSSLA